MSWIHKLSETYDNCLMKIGLESEENVIPLLPIFHTTQMAQIEIVIDKNGIFRRARVIPKKESRTIIPCSEESNGRTSGEAAHPLCDKLQYVAGDYSKRGGSRKPYSFSYITKLANWCGSPYFHQKANAVLEYVKKGNVIGDLINHNVLIAGDDGKLLIRWEKTKQTETRKIFEVLPKQEEAFVRWIVEIPGILETRVWRDNTLWDSWINYYLTTRKEKSLCYVSGEEEYVAEQHPAKLINDGDKSKLISSNDGSGFTFRGRFLTANQAATVGVETTQKAHLALRWLISRQGYRKDGMAIIAWATSGEVIPQLTDDSLAILNIDDLTTDEIPKASTAQEIAIRLKKRIAGYGKVIGDTTDIVVMAVDSATPGQGRLAITYYRELTGSDFLQRIDDWHESCAWIHQYRSIEIQDKVTGKIKQKYIPFIGAPSPGDIAEAAYGRRLDENLRKATVRRILPCIIDGQQIPHDLVESAQRRACNRIAMEHWEWSKTLTIACALYRKYHEKEHFIMTLDLDRKTRDYLYGRLLALAESLEEWALNKVGEKRETNAVRLMQRFSERPFSTWRTIELALVPYKARLGGQSKKRQRMIDEVIASFNDNDFLNDKRLSGEFLLGYHCQREALKPNEKNELDDLIEEKVE